MDVDGCVWHEEVEFDEPTLLNFFMKNLEVLPNGTYRVFCQGEECQLIAEDVPYIIKKINVSPQSIELVFPGDYTEALDASTLFVGPKNVLYCKVRAGKFTARFNRTSYLDLTKEIRHDKKSNQFALTIDKKKYFIQGVKA